LREVERRGFVSFPGELAATVAIRATIAGAVLRTPHIS